MVKQFNTFITWYSPGKGDINMEGGVLDRKGAPVYTLEQYLAGKTPYVTVAMDSRSFPYGTTLTNNLFRDTKGNLIPFRVTDTGSAFIGAGTSKMDIATDSLQRALTGPNFNSSFQVADNQNIIGAPTPTSAGATPDPNGCEGLSPNGLAGNKGFNMNNSPGAANGTRLPPGALGGNGVSTNYVPAELLSYGNGRLPDSVLVPISFGKGKLHQSAATAFEKLIAASGLKFPGVTDSYRSIEEQIRLKREKPSLAATPGTSNHGWGLAIDIDNGNRALFDPILLFFRYNAYKFNIHGLRVAKNDDYYSRGFAKGEEWHWEYKGGVASGDTQSTGEYEGYGTVFGLNLDGSIDYQDNGQGKFGYNTRNTTLVGVSLPKATLIAMFGNNYSSFIRANTPQIQVTNPATGATIVAPIVDEGPAPWTGNAIDLTYAAAKSLGMTGRDRLRFNLIR